MLRVVRWSVRDPASNSYLQTLRRAAKNTTYMFLNAEVERQKNIENGGNPTYIVEYHETMNVWLTALTAFDIVMVPALAAGWSATASARTNCSPSAEQGLMGKSAGHGPVICSITNSA